MTAWPDGGGEMAERIRSYDWAATPLGPIAGWPQSLRTVVELMLAARQPVYIAWGPSLTSLHNDAYIPILGTKHPQALGQVFVDVWREIWPEYRPVIAATLAGNAQYFVDQPVALAGRPGQPVSWFTFSWTPLRDETGAIAGFFCAATETTDKIRAQEAARLKEEAVLRSTELRYRTLFDSIDEGFCILEMKFDASHRPVDYRFVEVNPAFEKQTGLANAAGKWMRDLAPAHEQRWFDIYGQVALNGEPTRFVEHARALGRWFNVYAFRIGAPEDRQVAVLFDDITDRRQAQERLNNAFRIRTVGVMFWNRDYALSDMNDAFLEMTGFTREEALGMTWQDFTPEEFYPASRKAMRELASLGEAVPYEKQYFRKDATRWWGLFAGRKVGEEVVEFVLDVTERRQAATELRRLNETLEARVREEVDARLGAEEALRQSQKMEAIGQLTGGLAHDFNNLLTVIRASADLLRRPEITQAKRERYLDAISDTADRAAKLTAQLLAFARRQALTPQVFDVRERVEAITDMLRTLVGSRVELTIDTDCETCFVEADRAQFETAIVNMAANARDAMAEAGRLSISVHPTDAVPRLGAGREQGAFVAVSVADTGHGIPPDMLTHIFEPFFTTKDVGKGTGLGLSQVYGFAKQSGGEVEVQSEPEKGATFILYLPRVSTPKDKRAPTGTVTDATIHRGHVLVVEDNEQVGAFCTQILAELGFETTWAGDAESALQLLQSQPRRYAAVFSDVVMPGMTGVELGREIRRRMPDLPVILTSGYSHALATESRHGFPLLNKPYSLEELAQALQSAIGGSAAQRH